MTVGELTTALLKAVNEDGVSEDSLVTIVTMDGMKVVCHAFVDHVEHMSCIAGTDNDGIELSGQRWA